jgi:hypothetical protein
MSFKEKLIEARRHGEVAYALSQLIVNDDPAYLVAAVERIGDLGAYHDPYLLEEHVKFLERRP